MGKDDFSKGACGRTIVDAIARREMVMVMVVYNLSQPERQGKGGYAMQLRVC